jgi:hypothetical protein
VQKKDSMTIRRMIRRCTQRACWAAVFGFLAGAAQAAEQPIAAMMEPVHGLVNFMSTLSRGAQPTVFAKRGVCIVENFAPYLFCGLQAAANWAAGFRSHATADGLADLTATFAAANDFSQSGKRVYFSLPTTWTGTAGGKHFEEHGAWAFVLVQEDNTWRILSYGWGVTVHSEPH